MFKVFDAAGEFLGSIEVDDGGAGLIGILLLPFMPFLIVGGLGLVVYGSINMVSLLLRQLPGVMEGDMLSFEVLGIVIATGIAWLISYLILVFARKENFGEAIGMALPTIFLGTYILSLIAIAIVDIGWNGAFDNFLNALWFIIAMALSLIFMAIWAIVTGFVGIFIVGLMVAITKIIIITIKFISKTNRIKRSDFYNETMESIRGTSDDNIRKIVVSNKDVYIDYFSGRDKVLDFMSKGYALLDENGRLAFTVLLVKECKGMKVIQNGDTYEIYNKEYWKKTKAEARKKILAEKEEIRRRKKEEKKSTKKW